MRIINQKELQELPVRSVISSYCPVTRRGSTIFIKSEPTLSQEKLDEIDNSETICSFAPPEQLSDAYIESLDSFVSSSKPFNTIFADIELLEEKAPPIVYSEKEKKMIEQAAKHYVFWTWEEVDALLNKLKKALKE